MKTMSCKELGGPCDQRLTADSWNGMVRNMTKHVKDTHPETEKEMEKMHAETPEQWGNEMKPKWEAIPEA